MADNAHRLTDEKLEEMEKRLSAIYSRAEKEIQKTADEYFSKFAKQDEAKRKLLEQGKITEEEYTKWRKGKVMYGKRFTEMKEECAGRVRLGGSGMMNIIPKQVLNLAAKYIGYKEKASNKDLYSFEGNAGKGNYTLFQAELAKAGFWNNNKQGYEWCTSFVAWCFWRLCGNVEAKRILCLTGDYGASCTAWASYYKAQARLFTKPKVGDQYFQRGSDGQPCHTGIVETVNGNTFTTIEGNAGNMVKRVNRKLDSTVYGFGRPYYSEQKEEDNMIRYKTINEVPEGYRAEAQELIALGFNGYSDSRGLYVTEDMLRCMIINLRMCKALIAVIPEIDKDALFEEFKKNLKLTIEVK